MIRLGISKQIIIIALLPALIVATILSTYYIWDQFDSLSKALNRNGELIAKQFSPVAEYAVYSGNIELIKPLANSIIEDKSVLRIQILDKNNNSILDIKDPENQAPEKISIIKKLLGDVLNVKNQQISFIEPIISAEIRLVEDKDKDKITKETKHSDNNKIGSVVITLTTKFTANEQLERIQLDILIALAILLLTTLIVIRVISNITRPIKSLTQTVRNITSGDLDAHIELNSTGELGILESCINQMKNELKASQTDLEIQLDIFTKELQQTLEELEIRNAELDITRSKAIYASNAKSEFLANMSHEIRTPLSGIIGFTELLQGTTLSRQQKDYANTIQKSSKSLLQIINDILDLSKIESGKTEISTSEFNIIDIIEDIINLLSPVALDKNIELFYRIKKNVPVIIKSDPFRIHQILTNLIGNAIKFTEKGYVYLQVTTEVVTHGCAVYEPKNGVVAQGCAVNEPKDGVVAQGCAVNEPKDGEDEVEKMKISIKFSVSDTGIGMSKSDKQKLFKAFTQADTSITRRFGGTGLGLVISRKLTLLMKGEIGFDSTEGKGSTFWFCVPVFFNVAPPVPEVLKKSRLAAVKIALISNHFIAKQAFKTLFKNAQCTVNDYSVDKLTAEVLTRADDIEKDNDVIVFFLSRNDINRKNTVKNLSKLSFSKPSLLIASTRSHKKLRNLQQHIFDAAVFTSEKTELIKQKLINTINKNTTELSVENMTDESTKCTDWSNINVMVVDDNEVNLRLAEIILHKHKCRATTARSGEQALDYASMRSFDIVFMDLHMPGLDGYATTKKIREITPGKQPVIIALTANALPQEKEKVINSGMNGILIKPVSDAMLQKVLNQWTMNSTTSKDPQISVMNTVINPPEFTDQTSVDIPTNNNGKYEKVLDQGKNIFSIDLAKEFTGENEELAYELFSMLRAELDDYRKKITIAIKNADLKKLHEQAHKLHGASRCCGTTELKNSSSHIENLINQNIKFDIEKETRALLIAIKNVKDYKITAL